MSSTLQRKLVSATQVRKGLTYWLSVQLLSLLKCCIFNLIYYRNEEYRIILVIYYFLWSSFKKIHIFMKISICTVKTNSNDCPPREKQTAICIFGSNLLGNQYPHSSGGNRIMVLCEKAGVTAEEEVKEQILRGKNYLNLQKNKLLSFH